MTIDRGPGLVVGRIRTARAATKGSSNLEMRKPTYEKGKARRSLIPIQLRKALAFILITDMFKLPSIDMLPLVTACGPDPTWEQRCAIEDCSRYIQFDSKTKGQKQQHTISLMFISCWCWCCCCCCCLQVQVEALQITEQLTAR